MPRHDDEKLEIGHGSFKSFITLWRSGFSRFYKHNLLYSEEKSNFYQSWKSVFCSVACKHCEKLQIIVCHSSLTLKLSKYFINLSFCIPILEVKYWGSLSRLLIPMPDLRDDFRPNPLTNNNLEQSCLSCFDCPASHGTQEKKEVLKIGETHLKTPQ